MTTYSAGHHEIAFRWGGQADGNVTGFTDENEHVSHQGFDVMGRRVSQTDPSGAVTAYGYDVLGRVASVEAPGKPVSSVVYSNGDATTMTPATRAVTRAGGVVATTSFDADGEPVSVTYSDGTPSESYTFDPLGRVVGSSRGGVAVSRSFDTVGDVLSSTRAGSTVSYGLVHPGRVGTLRYPNGQVVTRGYDASGRWNKVTDWNNQSVTFSYDADGNVTDTVFANTTSVTRVFDGADRVSKVIYGFSGGGWPVTYTRGAGGELVGASQLGGSNTWAYDPGRQLTATTNPTTGYGFDTTGNPTTLNTTTQAFDPSGELCWAGPTSGACGNPPAGSTTYGYDADGQRTSAGTSSFSYDGTGQMTSATTTTGTSSYTYAPDGLRTSKTVGGTTTVFAWDDTTPVPALLQDGGNSYLYGPDGLPVERIGTDPTRWLMCDATGSVALTTDGAASITSVQGYDPWGNPTLTTGTPVSLGWQHQYQDTETGYYNLWHRSYDPATAQFLTPDPLFALTGSRYGYAGNDPINGSDPSGLFCVGSLCTQDVGHAIGHAWDDTGGKAVSYANTHRHQIADIAVGAAVAVGAGLCVAGTAGVGTAVCVGGAIAVGTGLDAIPFS